MPSLEQEKDLYEKTGLQGGMVSAQNWGGGVEVTLGNPRHSHKNVYKSPLPKTKIFEQKATNALPLEAKKCALPSQKMQYFKRVEQKES